MRENCTQNWMDMLPLGVGYCKLLFNDNNEAFDFMFLDVNPAFERLTGWSRQDLQNKPASVHFKNEEAVRLYWLSFYTNVVRSGRTREMTQWMKVLKQYMTVSVIPVDQTYFSIVLREAGPEPLAFDMEEAADQNFGALDAVFSSSHDAVALLEYGEGEYRYVRSNDAHQKLLGYHDIHGLKHEEIMGKETAEAVRPYYERCISTGQPVRYEQELYLTQEKRIWQTELIPIFSKGGIRYILMLAKDTTETKRIQAENADLNRRLKAMFNQHSAIQVIYDPASGHIVDASPAACAFYGYTREELRSMMISDINLLPPKELEQQFQMALTACNYYFSAIPYRLKSGETRLLDVYACPIFSGGRHLVHSITFDVTDRETYRNDLLKEKELLKTTLQSIGDGVVTTDRQGRITSLNKVAQTLTGWDSAAAIGRPFEEVFILCNEDSGQIVENPVEKVLKTGRTAGLANHTELVNRQGKRIPIADSAAPIKMDGGKSAGVVMVFRDVRKEKRHNRQVEFLSYRDALTGLYNRRYIEKIMAELMLPENLPLSVIMGDVNGLKITNDVFGHKAGDALLRGVAKLLLKNCGPGDVVARWGGDEFVAFLPRTHIERAEAIIQKIKGAKVTIKESHLNLSFALGCASRNTIKDSLENVMREAEDAMYHQKLLEGKSYRNAIINSLLATLYENSNETEAHSKRIERHCHAVGNELRLSSKEMSELSLLALLHDIGKVSIDPNILKKPGPLLPEEWDEVKHHPEVGYRIAQATPELSIIADLILAHHERWDGKGYPNGLGGERIPLACRILAVADAFDAMTSDRPYRKALGRKAALAEIERNAGIQFDADITGLFLRLLREEDEKEQKGIRRAPALG